MDAPDALSMLVPVVHCPECREPHWLVDEQMYLPGGAPRRFKGQSPVVFPCCNKMQYVSGDRVRYRAMQASAAA